MLMTFMWLVTGVVIGSVFRKVINIRQGNIRQATIPMSFWIFEVSLLVLLYIPNLIHARSLLWPIHSHTTRSSRDRFFA